MHGAGPARPCRRPRLEPLSIGFRHGSLLSRLIPHSRRYPTALCIRRIHQIPPPPAPPPARPPPSCGGAACLGRRRAAPRLPPCAQTAPAAREPRRSRGRGEANQACLAARGEARRIKLALPHGARRGESSLRPKPCVPMTASAAASRRLICGPNKCLPVHEPLAARPDSR